MVYKLVLLFVLLSSCKKLNEKKLTGDWEVQRIEIQDGGGFTYFDSTFEIGKNQLSFKPDSVVGKCNFEFTPLGSNFMVSDSLILQNYWSLNDDLILLTGQIFSLKVELLTKNQFIFNYYDYNNYRLKTFFLRKK
jgi:hypothetical protein